jgi:hypothetical protein
MNVRLLIEIDAPFVGLGDDVRTFIRDKPQPRCGEKQG